MNLATKSIVIVEDVQIGGVILDVNVAHRGNKAKGLYR